MKKLLSPLILILTFTAADSRAFAQRETSTGVEVDKDLALIRRDLRADKKKLIAMNVTLTETEATSFWPVYDQYAAEMARHNDEFYALIKDYIASQKTITDAQAATFLNRWSDIQVEQAKTRQKYVPLIEQVIPARKAAVFFQIDRRIYTLMDMQVSSELPLLID